MNSIYLFAFLLVFSSCTRTIYMPVETIRSKDRIVEHRDSIFVSDSVIFRIKGDTIWIEKYRYMYRDRMISDTLLLNDTIRVPYPVVEQVEVNAPTGFSLLEKIGLATLVIFALIGVAGLFKSYLKKIFPFFN